MGTRLASDVWKRWPTVTLGDFLSQHADGIGLLIFFAIVMWRVR